MPPLTDLGNQSSLIASRNGFDGRTTRGHVDDYWVGYQSAGPDPWEGHWPEHTWGGCTANYMNGINGGHPVTIQVTGHSMVGPSFHHTARQAIIAVVRSAVYTDFWIGSPNLGDSPCWRRRS